MSNKYYKNKQRKASNFSVEEQEKKRQYHRDRNENLSDEEKQKKVEYTINHYLALKKIN